MEKQLLFAPDHRDPELVRTRRAIEQQSCGLEDRDIVVGVFFERGRSTMGNQHVSALDASAARQRLGGEEGQFVALLIGKDGREKYRTEQSPDLKTIFALIDGMPMRRKEMGSRHTNCGQPQQ